MQNKAWHSGFLAANRWDQDKILNCKCPVYEGRAARATILVVLSHLGTTRNQGRKRRFGSLVGQSGQKREKLAKKRLIPVINDGPQ